MKPSEFIRENVKRMQKEDGSNVISSWVNGILEYLYEQHEKEIQPMNIAWKSPEVAPVIKKIEFKPYQDQDKHVFEEELLGVDTGVPGGDKTAKVYGVKKEDGTIHISRVEYKEPVSERNEKECHCGKDGHALNSVNCPKHGTVSERNALIDELIENIPSLFLTTEDFSKVVWFLKSKKK